MIDLSKKVRIRWTSPSYNIIECKKYLNKLRHWYENLKKNEKWKLF